MTQSLEDYLETIYLISRDKNFTRVKDISGRLSVKMPSVITAVRELKNLGYLSQEKYGYVEMTDKGRQAAERIFKKHSVLKDFLTRVVGVSDAAAEKDACAMEHILSEETLRKIGKFSRKRQRRIQS